MPIRTIASVVIATVLGLAGSREPHLRAGQSDLAFSLHRGFLIVLKGQVGFMEGLTFILDTGTVRSIVDLRIARALGLRGSSSQILSFNSAIAAEEIVVPSIRLGPFSVVSPTVLAADLSALTNTQGVTPDGIVGLDVLRGRCFTIDYSAQRVLFRPHARWDASLRFDRQSPYLVVNTLVDSIPFRVIVDTGAEGMLLFERAIPRTWVPRLGKPSLGSDATGHVRLRAMRAGRIWLGLMLWRDRQVFVIPGAGPDPSFYDGAMGPVALGLSKVQFDLGRMVLSWRYRPE